MTKDELLDMVSVLSTELLVVKRRLATQEAARKEQQHVLESIDNRLDETDIPKMHVVNRVEDLIERAGKEK